MVQTLDIFLTSSPTIQLYVQVIASYMWKFCSQCINHLLQLRVGLESLSLYYSDRYFILWPQCVLYKPQTIMNIIILLVYGGIQIVQVVIELLIRYQLNLFNVPPLPPPLPSFCIILYMP